MGSFEACGLPEGLQYLHLIEKGLARSGRNNPERAAHWAERAKSLGFGTQWRRAARDEAGTGTLMHVSLHTRGTDENPENLTILI